MQGMAPTMGPKKGMMLVTPMTTLMSTAKSMRSSTVRKKHSTPMMALSRILPLRKPEKIRLARLHTARKWLAFFTGSTA